MAVTIDIFDLLMIKGVGKARLPGLVRFLLKHGVKITDNRDCLRKCSGKGVADMLALANEIVKQ